MIRLAILGSTRGTNMLALIKAIEQKRLLADIRIVISNKSDAIILQRAREYQLQARFLDPAGLSRDAYDAELSRILHAENIELIVLIGYMRLLSTRFVTEWANKVINIHPSLLPAYAGKMDLAVHRAVIEAGEKETGCSVHYVTEAVDAGPIILQKKCIVERTDTDETLKERVQGLEGEALVEAIQLISRKSRSVSCGSRG